MGVRERSPRENFDVLKENFDGDLLWVQGFAFFASQEGTLSFRFFGKGGRSVSEKISGPNIVPVPGKENIFKISRGVGGGALKVLGVCEGREPPGGGWS